MEWERILSNSVKDGKIKELHLQKLPVLKTCNNWKDVKPLGWIDHKMKHSHYKGVLVKLNDNLYFVREQTVNALSEYIHWNLKTTITVTPD